VLTPAQLAQGQRSCSSAAAAPQSLLCTPLPPRAPAPLMQRPSVPIMPGRPSLVSTAAARSKPSWAGCPRRLRRPCPLSTPLAAPSMYQRARALQVYINAGRLGLVALSSAAGCRAPCAAPPTHCACECSPCVHTVTHLGVHQARAKRASPGGWRRGRDTPKCGNVHTLPLEAKDGPPAVVPHAL
jgi:hypothetical protein